MRWSIEAAEFIGFKQHTSWDWTTEPWKMMINVDFSINNGGFMGL